MSEYHTSITMYCWTSNSSTKVVTLSHEVVTIAASAVHRRARRNWNGEGESLTLPLLDWTTDNWFRILRRFDTWLGIKQSSIMNESIEQLMWYILRRKDPFGHETKPAERFQSRPLIEQVVLRSSHQTSEFEPQDHRPVHPPKDVAIVSGSLSGHRLPFIGNPK